MSRYLSVSRVESSTAICGEVGGGRSESGEWRKNPYEDRYTSWCRKLHIISLG